MKQQTNKIEWKEVELGDLSEIITGGTPSTTKKEYWENGTVPWLPSGDLKNKSINKAHKFITKLGLNNSSAKIMPKNTVVIALTGATTGQTGILGIDASANQSVTGILPSDKYISKYLFYFLRTIREKIISQSYGGAQPHISQGYVKKLKIPLPFSNGTPDLKEQERIVLILEKAEKVKAKGDNAGKLLDEYLKSVFNEMFYKRGFEEVEIVKLIKIMTDFVANGSFASLKENAIILSEPNYAYYVRLVDIRKGLGHSEQKFVDKKTFDFLRKSSLEERDIIIANVGANFGESFIFKKQKIPSTIAPNMIIIRVNEKIINPIYLNFLLSSNFGRNKINAIASATGQPKFNKTQLKKMKIPLPPLPLQQKFAKIVEHVEGLKENVKKTKQNSEELFNSLIQKAFRGEL